MTNNIFAKFEIQEFKLALKAAFPNAIFKVKSIGTAPNGLPAVTVTGYGEVSLFDMELIENKMQLKNVYVVTEAKSYSLI